MPDYTIEDFTFKVPGREFMPAYRAKRWDGQIKLYNLYSQRIYAGLEAYILKFCQERNYTVELPKRNSPPAFSETHLESLLSGLNISIGGKSIDPHKHQKEAILHGMNTNRCLLLSPTGSGKSLIIYTLLRHYLNLIPKEQKVLIIVPTIGLVSQMFSDICDYAGKDKRWNPREQTHLMCHFNLAVITQTTARILSAVWSSLWRRSTLVQVEVAEFNYDQTYPLPVSYRNDRNTRRNAHSQVSD